MYELFISTFARRAMSASEIKSVVLKLSARNISCGLTGILIYNEGEFYQILEGEKEAILKIKDEIKDDKLHGAVHVIWEGDIAERGYRNWGLAPSMMQLIGLDSVYAEKGPHISTAQRLLETLSKSSGFEYSTI